MQNPTPNNSIAPVGATAEKSPQASQSDLNGVPARTNGGDVLALPPNRDKFVADLRVINSQFFLMICDVHRGMLINLSDVPRRLLAAAENLMRHPDVTDWSKMWSEALVLYMETLTDSRKQILTATRLHGVAEIGLNAADAINSIEKTLPSFLRAVAQTSEDQRGLASTAKELSAAARILDKILTGLLETVEISIERARANGVSDQSGSRRRSIPRATFDLADHGGVLQEIDRP
ncbi:MAG: hypothetical protein KAR37_05245 [Alphaproteobacteria bacterium]|nr:hypothetical protein [Alphaproteobacteria bacterium]